MTRDHNWVFRVKTVGACSKKVKFFVKVITVVHYYDLKSFMHEKFVNADNWMD